MADGQIRFLYEIDYEDGEDPNKIWSGWQPYTHFEELSVQSSLAHLPVLTVETRPLPPPCGAEMVFWGVLIHCEQEAGHIDDHYATSATGVMTHKTANIIWSDNTSSSTRSP